jgi:hypothetical protein
MMRRSGTHRHEVVMPSRIATGRRTFLTLAALLAAAATPRQATAQGIMGRMKKKAVDAAASAAAKKATESHPVGTATPAPNAPPNAKPNAAPNAAPDAAGNTLPPVPATPAGPEPLPGRVLALTAPVVERFVNALDADARVRAYGAPLLAKPVPAADARKACIALLVKDPNFQALQTRKAAQPWEISGHELKDSVVNERCGVDYPTGFQRYISQHGQAVALGTGGLNDSQYYVLKERAAPFCDALAKGHAKKLRIAYLGNGGGGKNAFYVYTAEEADALAPHCAEIMRDLAVLER